MKLLPREQEGLLVHHAGSLAQKRLARGLKLNHPEAVALIAHQIQEFARDGNSTVAELMDKGRQLLGRMQVMDGVADMIPDVQIEATFPDGTKLVTVHFPICTENGNLDLALYGSFLPIPRLAIFEEEKKHEENPVFVPPPGSLFPAQAEDIEINKGRERVVLKVDSICDRPIQIGSHYHFIETNKRLIFDRALSYGKRLDLPAGNASRFEPGESKMVTLVDIAGKRIVRGGNSFCDGPVSKEYLPTVMEKVISNGFGNTTQHEFKDPVPCHMSRFLYAKTYGPTTGDKVMLGDTCLIIEVEKDFTVYGDECKFGGGKVLRDGMGQCAQISCHDVLDTIITNCLIVDAIQGIIKADVGIKDGKISGIGKGGNPDTMEGVYPNMIVGAGTEVISGEGLILTAGAVDSHIHFVCPQLLRDAITSGITTMIGGGTGPSEGTCATTCSPGPNHIKYMIQSTDVFPANYGFTGKGNVSQSENLATELVEQIEAGAIGLKLHEDWGTSPAAIDTALRVADAYDVQITIHTDSLNESSCVEETIAAFKGRTIHSYHSEGAGGGHAPDIIAICGVPCVLPSSTNPTRPYTVNTVDEHLDMLIVCHNLNKNLREDVAFAESRIRAETMAAEDILHDMGAISMMSSDSQAMGRIGEVICRTWQMADKMKKIRGKLPAEIGDNDNFRVKRYIAKYTVNPAIAHGINHIVGTIEVGKMADLVLWQPAFFGVKPNTVIKGGQIAWALVGNPNSSIPTPHPVVYRKMYGAYGQSVGENSCIFVSKLSVEKGTVNNYGIRKHIVPVSNVRNITKMDMVLNEYCPIMKVDPEKYSVHVLENVHGKEEWVHLTCEPAATLPLTQRYFLF